MASYRDFIIDSLMQNPAISNVEPSMVMGTEKRIYLYLYQTCQ